MSRTIAENLAEIRQEIEEAAHRAGRDPSEVALMAVTKTVSAQRINEAIHCGVTLIGENKAQELCEKYDALDREGVDIHFIGKLQTNKVKYIIDKVSLIHSVDNERLAQEISRQAGKLGITMRVLVEVNIGGEESKSGIEPEKLDDFIDSIRQLPHIRIDGLMAIPPFDAEGTKISGYFQKMRQLFVDIKAKRLDNVCMNILSMGMSHDFPCAIENGSTLVRVGTAIFGERDYTLANH